VPVIVRRYPSKKNHGITHFDGRKFYIRIDSEGDDATQLETLLHEYSHALTINDAYNHKEPWAQNYSKIYTAWEALDGKTTTTLQKF